MKIKFLKINSRVQLPRYETEGAAGLDLRAFLEADITIPPMGRVKIPTGLRMEIPAGYEGQVRPRSGLALKSGLTVLNSPGTIDCDYRGDLEVILINLGDKDVIIKDAQRIAQLVIVPVCCCEVMEVRELEVTKRDTGGFGSTDTH